MTNKNHKFRVFNSKHIDGNNMSALNASTSKRKQIKYCTNLSCEANTTFHHLNVYTATKILKKSFERRSCS